MYTNTGPTSSIRITTKFGLTLIVLLNSIISLILLWQIIRESYIRYLKDGLLDVQLLGPGFAWLDTGTMSSLLQAANFVETIQSPQGIVISAPEEIAYINGFVDKDKLLESANRYGKSPYGVHLKAVAEGKVR